MDDDDEPTWLQRKAKETDFRLRGTEVTRVEAFSDVVFGFALTLLVVSLEVPHTFNQLLATMSGFVPFAISFAILAQVWWVHHNFFRRYGLQDGPTILLNLILLFVILFYVYPLKFLFNFMFEEATGQYGRDFCQTARLHRSSPPARVHY